MGIRLRRIHRREFLLTTRSVTNIGGFTRGINGEWIDRAAAIVE